MALDDANWFTEVCDEGGTAFSLRIREKLHEEQSDYQHIAIYETETYGRLMVIDGFIMLTDRDNFLYHEMMSHPALYTHPAPRRVLIIGGGDCGTLREVLKHPEVERADQVEIDERVTRLAEEYFPPSPTPTTTNAPACTSATASSGCARPRTTASTSSSSTPPTPSARRRGSSTCPSTRSAPEP